jgi:hypothetical protein
MAFSKQCPGLADRHGLKRHARPQRSRVLSVRAPNSLDRPTASSSSDLPASPSGGKDSGVHSL